MAKAVNRRAEEIIDAALRDNRWWERLCFGLVVLFVAAGLSVLAFGIINGRDALAAVGGGVSALFVPALWYARGFRRDNIRIRLYEIPLAMARDGSEAAGYVREAVGAGGFPPAGSAKS